MPFLRTKWGDLRDKPWPNAKLSSVLPKFQFSLARMLVVVTIAAIALGLAVSMSGFMSLIFVSIVWCVLPTPLVVCAIFGRGELRAFAIGGLVPWLLLLKNTPAGPALLILIWLVVMPVVCGIVAVATYRWVQPRA